MTNATQTDDARTDMQKLKMAEFYEEYEADYRAEDAFQVVYEDDEKAVVADHKGHELNEWASDFGIGIDELSETMHALARQACDYSWVASDPIVFDKLED